MEKIKIFDTTLRDGEQSPFCTMTLQEKVEFAKQLEKLNVDIIEAGFAASSQKDMQAIEEISKVVKKPIITSLARLCKEDIDKANESLKFAEKKRIHVFIATSKIHMDNKLHMNEGEILLKVREMVKYAKSLCDDIEFSLEDATRSDRKFMVKVITLAIDSGATTINIPDTVGYTVPDEYKDLICYIKNNVPNLENITLSAHCHNDLGHAVSNTLAGIEAGITQVECTVNGIGERAGNASLEEVVMNLKVRNDYYKKDTNICINQIKPSSDLLVDLTGNPIQRHKPIVGANAFLHEAGIHQAGVIENKETYEIIDSASLGIEKNNLVIGIHSGRHAFISKFESLGINIPKDSLAQCVSSIKEYLGEHKTISDDILKSIASNYTSKPKSKNIKILKK